MKFDASEIPEPYADEVSVGDVYKANGGRGNTSFWLVVAMGPRMSHCLGLDKDGLVVSSTSYGTHVFEQRERIGRCEDIVEFTAKIIWERI